MFLSFTPPVSPWPHWRLWRLSQGKMDSEEERLLKEIRGVIDQFVLAAEEGNSAAKIRLGIEYKDGVGVPEDLVKAEEWLMKGVQGLVGVQEGPIREQRSRQNISPLAHLLRLAAEKGNVDAQIQFGIACMDGVNVQKDREKAEEWLMEGVKVLVDEQRSIENIPSSAMYSFLFHSETHVFFLLSSSQFFLGFHFLRSLPSAFSCVKDACKSPSIAPSNKIFSHVLQYRVANNMPTGKLWNISSCSWLRRHSLTTTVGLAGPVSTLATQASQRSTKE
jgi:hypothetical protein